MVNVYAQIMDTNIKADVLIAQLQEYLTPSMDVNVQLVDPGTNLTKDVPAQTMPQKSTVNALFVLHQDLLTDKPVNVNAQLEEHGTASLALVIAQLVEPGTPTEEPGTTNPVDTPVLVPAPTAHSTTTAIVSHAQLQDNGMLNPANAFAHQEEPLTNSTTNATAHKVNSSTTVTASPVPNQEYSIPELVNALAQQEESTTTSDKFVLAQLAKVNSMEAASTAQLQGLSIPLLVNASAQLDSNMITDLTDAHAQLVNPMIRETKCAFAQLDRLMTASKEDVSAQLTQFMIPPEADADQIANATNSLT